jgi:uncharacterized protein DUF1214
LENDVDVRVFSRSGNAFSVESPERKWIARVQAGVLIVDQIEPTLFQGTTAVNAFWSITLYDQDGFQVANSLNRFAVSSWMPFQYNPDGSLDLYFQNESPGADKEANWLPTPNGFNLTMRLYAPKSEALTGKWNPPPVMKAQKLPVLTTH